MIISSLHLKGFGKFKNREIYFKEGLNVLFGPNEAGKTTLQKFIEGMLFGFKKPYKSRRVFTPEIQSYQPWESEVYAGVMEYQVQGKKYLVERDFKKDEVIIRDSITGEDITNSFSQHKGTKEYNFPEAHMNINRNIFCNTISISQGQCVSDEDLAREVSTKLSNISYSGRGDISIRKACMELEKVLKEQIGSENAPKSPLGIFKKQIEDLEEEKAEVEGVLNKVRGFEAEMAQIRPLIMGNLEKKRKKEEEIKLFNHYLQAKKLKSVKEQEQKISKINKHIFGMEKYRYFPLQQRERIIEIREAVKNLENNLEEINRVLKKQREMKKQPQKYVERYNFCRDLNMESASYITRDYALYKSLQEQVVHKEKLAETLEKKFQDINIELKKDFWNSSSERDLYRAEKIEEEINQLKNSPIKNKIDLMEEKRVFLKKEIKNTKNLIIVVSILSGTLLIPTVLFHPLSILMMVIPAYLSYGIYKNRRFYYKDFKNVENEIEKLINMDWEEQEKINKVENELKELLKRNKVVTIRDLRVKISQYGVLLSEKDRLERDLRLARREIKDLFSRLRELENEITGILKSASLWKEGEEISEEKVEEYKNRISNFQSTFNLLQNLEEKIEELEENRLKIEKEINELKEEADYIYISAGVKSFDEFMEGCKRNREIEILLEQRKKYEEVLEAVLEGTSLQELKRVDLSVLDSPKIQEEVTEETINRKQKELEKINEDLSRARSRHGEFEAKIEAAFSGYPSLSEIEEELSIKREERDYLQQQASALRTAVKMIEIVARDIHRDFAPRLNEKVSNLISQITEDRYKQVKISKDMGITVMTPETGKHVNIHELSGGTIDQFYFSARLMIADLVTGNRNLPLILDDSFVHYDRKRLREALKTIVNIARNRQVILFTCHSREIDMLKEIKGKFQIFNLEEPRLLFLDRVKKKTERV